MSSDIILLAGYRQSGVQTCRKGKTGKGVCINMSKIDVVRKAMVEAMKAGDKERKDSLSMLLSALKNKAIDKRSDLTESEENEVVLKEIKQTKETLDLTPSERQDIIEECTGPAASGLCRTAPGPRWWPP